MTTRRRLLKSSAGLAAIIATGKAPAYLVRSMLAARHGLGARGGEPLPYDAEVEWLENNGLTQYIDTGILGGQGLRVQTNIKPLQLANDKWAIGSLDTDARIYVVYQYKPATRGGYWSGGYGTYFEGTTDTAFQNNTQYLLDVEFTDTEQILTVDGVEKQRWTKSGFSGTVTRSLWLFGRHGANENTNAFLCRMGVTKIWMNGILVRDFNPVRFTNELGNSEGAMYDRVSGELEPFRNKGTGAFLWGPDASAQNGGGYKLICFACAYTPFSRPSARCWRAAA